MSSRQVLSDPTPVSAPQRASVGHGETINSPQDIKVRLQYLKNDPIYKTQKPLQITPNFKDREGRSNVRLAPGEVETLNDIRGREDQFSLDKNGFQYVRAPTKFTEWDSQPKIGQKYLPELESLLRQKVHGCDEIMFYDARLRFANQGGARVEGLSYNPFARQVHTDNTEKSVLAKIRSLTDMKADYVLSGRCRIINIWRPIKHPVYDCGLAIADAAKLKEGDVIECDRHRSDTGKYWDTMGVAQYRPGYDWYYMSQQAESEVLLFKNYDSATDIPARTCLHTAFDIPSELIPADAPTRESIEVRALIFTYPEHGPRPSGGLNMQHPLAASLEQGHLKPVEFEHSLTDRVRTDIDEGSEVKDAVLLLRKREIRRLEQVQKQLQAQREDLVKRLHSAQQQIDIQSLHIKALQDQNIVQQQELKLQYSGFQEEARALSIELSEVRRRQTPNDQAEWKKNNGQSIIFTQQLERAQADIENWKAEAVGRSNEAVSRTWQSSVDEAVRREREKDAVIIANLRAEMKALQLAVA